MKKNASSNLIQALAVGSVMYFGTKNDWWYMAFMYWQLIVGALGVILLLIIGILSSKED